MAIADEITRIQTAKSDLKTSINAKTDSSHQITNELIDDYASFVDSIQGGGVELTSFEDLMKFMEDFILSGYDYTPLTDEEVTLYTPELTLKNYFIQKRSNDKYRAVWCETIPFLKTSSEIYFQYLRITCGNSGLYYPGNIYNGSGIHCSYEDSTYRWAYGSEVNTIEDAIDYLKSSTSSYTFATNQAGYKADTPYTIPVSNVIILDQNYKKIQSQRISSNETIVLKN